MDWSLAMERNREALHRIVLALFAMIGLAEGVSVERLPWPLYRAVLALLRPAEAAVRRLIVVAARGMVVKPPAVRAAPTGPIIIGTGGGRVSFRLHDPRRASWNRGHPGRGPEPRIRVFDGGFDPRVALLLTQARPAPAPEQNNAVNAQNLCHRLAAIKGALEDLPRQARRYVRWRAKPFETRRPKLSSTLRSGAPPGFRKKPSHEVHAILSECQWLASTVPLSDTS